MKTWGRTYQVSKKIVNYSFISLFFAVTLLNAPNSFADELVGLTHYSSAKQRRKEQQQQKPEEQQKESTPSTSSLSFSSLMKKELVTETFEIHPRYRQEYALDSNVLLESADEKFDSIFREKPGVEVLIPFAGRHSIRADYGAELEQFVKFPRENAENQYFESEVALNFTDLYIHAGENLSHTSSRSGTTFTERIPRLENKVDTEVGYKWNRFTLEGGYGTFYRRFNTSREKDLNYGTQEWSGKLFMDLTAKTKTSVEYTFTNYNYFNDSSRDSNGHQILAGIEGALLPKTTLYSKFGYERIGFESSAETDSDNFIAQVGTLYQPFSRTVVDLGWKRQTAQSTFANTNFLTEDQLFGRLHQRLTEKISGEADISYTHQGYDESNRAGTAGNFTGKRKDDLLSTAVKVAYQFTDWFSGDIKYQYNRRNSNASIFDYTDNLLTIGFEAKV